MIVVVQVVLNAPKVIDFIIIIELVTAEQAFVNQAFVIGIIPTSSVAIEKPRIPKDPEITSFLQGQQEVIQSPTCACRGSAWPYRTEPYRINLNSQDLLKSTPYPEPLLVTESI